MLSGKSINQKSRHLAVLTYWCPGGGSRRGEGRFEKVIPLQLLTIQSEDVLISHSRLMTTRVTYSGLSVRSLDLLDTLSQRGSFGGWRTVAYYSDDAQRNFKTTELEAETREHGVNARGYLPSKPRHIHLPTDRD